MNQCLLEPDCFCGGLLHNLESHEQLVGLGKMKDYYYLAGVERP